MTLRVELTNEELQHVIAVLGAVVNFVADGSRIRLCLGQAEATRSLFKALLSTGVAD